VHLEIRRKVPAGLIELLAVRVIRRQLAERVVHHDQIEPGGPQDPLDRTERRIGRLAGLDARHRGTRQPSTKYDVALAQPRPHASRTSHVGDLQDRMIDRITGMSAHNTTIASYRAGENRLRRSVDIVQLVDLGLWIPRRAVACSGPSPTTSAAGTLAMLVACALPTSM
jgi:hypothetical protein